MDNLINDYQLIKNIKKSLNKTIKGGKNSYLDKVERSYQNKKKQFNKLNPKINYSFKFVTDTDKNRILVVSHNDKIVMKAEYDLIGIYNKDLNLWHYGYAIDYVDKKSTLKSKNIKKLQIDVEENYNNYDAIESETLHFYSSNPHLFTDSDNIPLIIKIMMFIMDSIWYISINYNKNESNLVEYISIRKIIT
ncbi:MAG: hypothetical protein CMF62_00425 [Magnetococcales bacterium]|nr:hypothetical protein [Magnetococcales bacterium]|tara:strand:- start:5125 stop:5700 length:576 start_codon:yes stop_codon:yes gene_type:complete